MSKSLGKEFHKGSSSTFRWRKQVCFGGWPGGLRKTAKPATLNIQLSSGQLVHTLHCEALEQDQVHGGGQARTHPSALVAPTQRPCAHGHVGQTTPSPRVCSPLVSGGELFTIIGDKPHSMLVTHKTKICKHTKHCAMWIDGVANCAILSVHCPAWQRLQYIAESLAPHPGPQAPVHRPNTPGRWPTRNYVASNKASNKPMCWPSQAKSQLKAGVVKPSRKI